MGRHPEVDFQPMTVLARSKPQIFHSMPQMPGELHDGLPQVNSKDEEEPEDSLTVFLQESDEEDITEDNKDENKE